MRFSRLLDSVHPLTEKAGRRRLGRWCGWYLAANAVLMLLLALRYLDTPEAPAGAIGIPFGVAMYVGHMASLSALVLLPVFIVILIRPGRRFAGWLAVMAGTAATVVLFVDTVVYQQYRFHINAGVLEMLFSSAADEIFAFSWIMYVQAIALVAGALLVHWVLARLAWRFANREGKRYGAVVATALVAAFFTQHLTHAWADAVGYQPITRQARLLPAYSPTTAKRFLAGIGVDVVNAQALPAATGSGTMKYPLESLDEADSEARPNILFVVIDAWRFDALGEKVTPNIHRFARENLRFTNHFSGGNASRTGIFSLFYGIPGTYWESTLDSSQAPVLTSRLLELDYRMGIFKSNEVTVPPFHRNVFEGIDNLRLKSDGDSTVARDRDLTKDFLGFVERGDDDRPFFSLLFYDAPHAGAFPEDGPAPFQPSWEEINYSALDEDFDPTAFFNRYLNSVHFVDRLVGRVLNQLEARGILDETIVVITGDHGQEFNDTGLNYWGHNGNYSRYQTQVPLVVRWPGKAPGRFNHLTSHFDVAPTILSEALGIDNAYQASSIGHSLFSPVDRGPLIISSYNRYAVRTDAGYVVVQPYGGMDVYTLDYRPLDKAPETGSVKKAFEIMRRFHAG